MSDTLHVRRLNHGQSEVWLSDESKRRLIATNAVYSAVRKHCSKEELEAFYSPRQAHLGNIAEVFAAGTMVQELGLVKA